MKITIERNLLLNKLNVVSHALPAKSPLPVLTGIKIEVAEDSITFIASNSDISIRTKMGYEGMVIEETGSIVVPGKMFCDIIRTLNSKDVELYTEGTVLRIKANKGKYKLHIMDESTYPNINFELGQEYTPLDFNGGVFSELVKNVIFSASQNEKKPILTGVNFEYNPELKQVITVATDSFRLSRMTAEMNDVEPFNITIPSASLNELLKCLDAKDEIKMYTVGSTSVRFSFADIDFISRMLDTNYPATSKLITTDFAMVIEVNKEEVLTSTDRIMVLSPTGTEKEKELTYNVVGLRQESDTTAILEISNASAGEAKEEIAINVIKPCQDKLNIKFSGKYFIDSLKSFKSDKVRIKFNGSARPFIMEGENDKGLIQLILPVRM